MTDEKTCFVLSPIGEEGSETREQADNLFEYVIKGSVEPKGYNPVRADHIAEPGDITNQIIEYVVESPLVIADLTDKNPNVFYELAVRHSIQKPTIQLIDKDHEIPFDVARNRTIKFDLSDIESYESAKSEIADQIENIESEPYEVDTPISVSMDLKSLRESTDPEERSVADIKESLSDIQKQIVSIQNNLDDPKQIIPPNYIKQINREMVEGYSSGFKHEVVELKKIAQELDELTEKGIITDDRAVHDIELINSRLDELVHNIENRDVNKLDQAWTILSEK